MRWRNEAVDYANRSWLMEPEWPLDRAFWRHSLPVQQYPDGDGLALWHHDPAHKDPAVVYLRHDAESFLLAPTFDEFLTQWERVGYVSVPDLTDCREPATGFVSARSPRAQELRAALRLSPESGHAEPGAAANGTVLGEP